MPSATTHALFAKELLERLPELRKSIDRPELFYIGTQGPDVMFFSRYSFLPGSLHWLGGKMHREKTKELLFFLKDFTCFNGMVSRAHRNMNTLVSSPKKAMKASMKKPEMNPMSSVR
ncbi:MAG: hypothetical protein IIY52_08345, partial [Solobacterium sp.]|nr:hypothetical protein [Solobacterium sp.]